MKDIKENAGIEAFAEFDDTNFFTNPNIDDIISENEEKLKELQKAFDIAKTENDFGNGRYVRNVFEQAKMNQASRLLEKDCESITSDEITTITEEDIVIPEVKKGEMRRIGFC